MRFIEKITSHQNITQAIEQVKKNKGAPGVDEMTVDELDHYFYQHGHTLVQEIRSMTYRPKAVKRVYIPKSDGKQRPLGIPSVVDRVVQQATAQQLSRIFDVHFSETSDGFRPGRSAHQAIEKVLDYLNEGYEWLIDMDIEKYFDTVNHDQLISTLRERVKDRETLHLIRVFLKAGIMENGFVSPNETGVPQGGPLSPVLANIYLDKLDKELEARGLHFVRYADDTDIFVKSEMAANRVMKSITGWIERKLFLQVNVTKTKVVRPTQSQFLGFTFWKNQKGWQCKPSKVSKTKLYDKTKEVLKRKHAVSRPLAVTFTKLNQIIRGWINYYRIGSMKTYLAKFGQWLRHKVRVIIIKQWKLPRRIYMNLQQLNRLFKCHFKKEDIYKVANSRLGWYRKCGMDVVNFTLSPKVLAIKKKDRPGLVDPLSYYLNKA
ncbi:group II intron reverse transcriptase/maturase [Tetragenococcus halophilus]|uniref:group II intron reverse transcriptase/maturase n=2 Tax=Tetragenococcus halophilus TaxID=51669 RepID=UPI0019267498|nr:group II intron reverse transcriptase/maturase [Tetragenococcus halophilus]MDN6725187.1 group II intron reverse transcriptase/maturase [Tetragenococcus halophilus]GEQ39105.1 group II intron reverse transcriptase/maturase [Tetragenococcus halophilus]GEQ41356.1 group II intron reverse transcriptase/maturase [Tetragenococcus halophilus]GEQ43609.1 group II intron reverse transcriptase/maturase [Tetragenococcus halophilus]GEQ45870.1 group II intron reverse transcriptase/maturase [Tetragenococcus